MSVVSLLGVKVLNNPANFTDSYQFEITFECLEQLRHDLEWKLTYVGSATSAEHDQELDSLLVGPIPVGVNKFPFEADPPDMSRLPSSEVLGVTVILLTCSYDSREFVRVGYYVNNEYDSEELQANPPAKPILERIRRNILDSKPRVTRFAIKWDSEDSAPAEYPPEQPEADEALDDEQAYGAEEEEMQAALEREYAEAESKANDEDGGDAAMGGTEEAVKEEEEGSEGEVDLEAESSDDDDDEDEDDAGEGEADEDMEMGDGEEKSKPTSNGGNGETKKQSEVMVH